jgi:hypothetical protein
VDCVYMCLENLERRTYSFGLWRVRSDGAVAPNHGDWSVHNGKFARASPVSDGGGCI